MIKQTLDKRDSCYNRFIANFTQLLMLRKTESLAHKRMGKRISYLALYEQSHVVDSLDMEVAFLK